MRSLLLVVVAAATLAAGCGSENEDAVPPAAPSASGVPADGGLSVEEAVATASKEPLLVRGALLVREESVRLCSALAESHPPQCGEPSLRVEGLEVGAVGGLREAEGVRWSEREISLLGTVADGALRVTENAM